MPTPVHTPFSIPLDAPRGRDIEQLHLALGKVGLPVAAGEVKGSRIGPSTQDAIRQLQQRAGLQATGALDEPTVAAIGAEVAHAFFAGSRTRTAKLQDMLARTGHPVDPQEQATRWFGDSTQAALRAFQGSVGMPADGRMAPAVWERLETAALAARLQSKTQVARVQRMIIRAVRIGRVDAAIDRAEVQRRELGPTTQAAVRALQRKYGLAETGELDPATYDRLTSIAASRPRPVAALSITDGTGLATVRRSLRLNMKSADVVNLQHSLAFLGFTVDQAEARAQRFGPSTRAAVIEFQKRSGLPVDGHVTARTRDALNRAIVGANPDAAVTPSYRVRGAVRDALWQGKQGVTVQVAENALRGASPPLGARPTLANGFYDLPYQPPTDPVDGKVKRSFQLLVRVLDAGGAELDRKLVFNPTPITWVNFTDGDLPYKGTPEYDARLAAVNAVLGATPLTSLQESDERQDITFVALHARLQPEDVMQLVLAHRVAASIADAAITPDVVYAYVRQHLPPTLPSDLIGSTEGWTLIDALVEQTARTLIFLDAALQGAALDSAVRDNLVGPAVAVRRDAIAAAFARLRTAFALNKPLLIGNGRLQDVLSSSAVPAGDHAAVAEAFVSNGGMNARFWRYLDQRAGDIGGSEAVADLRTTAELAEISKNHVPTMTFLKAALSDPAHPVQRVADFAALDHAGWVGLLQANGGQVPDGTPGVGPQARIDTYASALAAQSERIFPGVAAAAAAARVPDSGLDRLDDVRALLAEHTTLDLASTSIDRYVAEQHLDLHPDVLAQTKLLQRVHRIAPTAQTTAALVGSKIHNATQVVFMGRERAQALLRGAGVEERTAATVVARAEFQYAQALARFADYRLELHRADPAAVVSHAWTKAEQQALLGEVPDLEELFGSLDFCECSHCASIFSPAAYLVDILRFLTRHDSTTPDRNVCDVLLARRPDLGNIKLNCANSDTPLPYVDLVCEVLEAAVHAPGTSADFSFQSDTSAAELRAFPQNVREDAYSVLATADHPMRGTFDLWQEEARVWLAHLGAPRASLMETLQARPPAADPVPADGAVAAESLGMSSHETGLVTTAAADAARQSEIWGFDCTRASVTVREVLDRAAIDYPTLEQVVRVGWVNQAPAAAPLRVDRTPAPCDVEQHLVVNLTVERFDRLHRFLRLWRRAGWAPWQLDLLLRAPRLANGTLDEAALVALRDFRRVQTALRLPFEAALALYGDLNTEPHVDPADLSSEVAPLYARLFQNRSVADPVDPALALPIAPDQTISGHKAAVVAGLAVTDQELDQLIALEGDELSVAALTRMHDRVALARRLRLTLTQLTALLDAWGADPLATPQATLDLLEAHEQLLATGLNVDEVDYLLQHRTDSPYGLREESTAQFLAGLREALRTSPADQRDGQVVSEVSSLTSLPPDQTRAVLTALDLLGAFTDPRLVQLAPDGSYAVPLTRAELPDAFAAADLLAKASLLLRRLKVSSADLGWLLAAPAAFGLLRLGDLPVAAAPAQPLLPAFLRLARWARLRRTYPDPEQASLRQVLDLAADSDDAGAPTHPLAEVHAALCALTRWPLDLIDTLHTKLRLSFDADHNDYTDLRTYERLARAVALVRRLGVDAATAVAWARRDAGAAAEAAVARQTRQAAKAKYDDATWLATAAPLMDPLRERKRDALIAHLLDFSQRTQPRTVQVGGQEWANPLWWKDSDDLLRYFLIDVEMAACQLTSRIKQAISSVQMFVQRAFLNLERPQVQVDAGDRDDRSSLNAWSQWSWMKSYRIWEAARKVFLYPENVIRPELRDDKSPFFRELEDELLQGDLTDDLAEAAFHHYLEKVHEVARLQVLGVYHEIQDDPNDLLPPQVDRLHVVARTTADPAVYYYRAFDLLEGAWSPWQKIDVDITGDHLVPVVYNRKLHLFWLVFAEKPQKVAKQPAAMPSPNSDPVDAPEPAKQLEIQLGWSVRTRDGWSSKRVSRQRLIHPWERPPHSYTLKPRYKPRENQLWMDLYISVSPEFNDTTFYDPWAGRRRLLTKTSPSQETLRPWHSSSFVFDGGVVAVKMRALRGSYRLAGERDKFGRPVTTPVFTTSWDYVTRDFGDAGRAIGFLDGPYENAPRLPLADGMHYRYNRLTNNTRPGTANPNRVTVLDNGTSRRILDLQQDPDTRLADRVSGPFELAFSQDHLAFDTSAWGLEPFIYSDERRSFFVTPEPHETQLGYNRVIADRSYRFRAFYHPYTALFLRELNRGGLEGLLNRRIQTTPQSYYPGSTFSFAQVYRPVPPDQVEPSAASDIVDFDRSGAYALYNWEIFFHAPFLIACRLMENQRFEAALRWFHLVFDPTSVDGAESPQRFWVTKPFYDTNSEAYRKQRIEDLLASIGVNLDQLRAWRNDPFNPHRIARFRPIAYQKAVVMRYLDNLIGWGDQLFRRDTIEAINEATLLYSLAQELLGPKPEQVPSVEHDERSWNELREQGEIDEFGQASVPARLESHVPQVDIPASTDPTAQPLPLITGTYFCIPPNDVLLGYWPTVAGRLFKIRNCMNFEGVVRQLPLFEPPIDPALLVKAAAAGVDLTSVASPSAAQTSQYRYRALAAKAAELCGEVRALGDKLLSALEKRDAEQLAMLRATHESQLLEANRTTRNDQIEEAKRNIEALEQTKAIAESRRDFYRSREFISPWEGAALALSGGSAAVEAAIAVGYILAGGLRFIPDFLVGASGFGGSPHATADVGGGTKVADSAEAAVKTLQSVATALDKFAALASTMGSYHRRQDDWTFQGDTADAEATQADKQILAAQVRQALAEHELANLEQQITQASTVEEYLRSKYTGSELYSWMVTQLSTVYFQAYTQAFEMGQRAQAALQRELGRPDLSFVQFGYWDSLRKGLLAGERLTNDLARMDAAYLQNHTRELELTKHVSMAEHMPLSLLALKAGGTCSIVLPEWLYDLDFPGQYRRRVRSVALTIPCVSGPWTGVHATLALDRSAVRIGAAVGADYGDPLTTDDPTRFSPGGGAGTVIATSSAQNDAGVFELNPSADERYLPFEHAGAVSEWTLTLPERANSFNRDSITDVVLHVRYTANPADSPELTAQANGNLDTVLPNRGTRVLALKNEFPTAWARFLAPAPDGDQVLAFSLGPEHLPFYARGQTAAVTGVDLFVDGPVGPPADPPVDTAMELRLDVPGVAAPAEARAAVEAAYGNLRHRSLDVAAPDVTGRWSLRLRKAGAADFRSLAPDDVRNLYLVVRFQLS